jgi:hypothetical protein
MHALVGFGGVVRDREGMIVVVVAVRAMTSHRPVR